MPAVCSPTGPELVCADALPTEKVVAAMKAADAAATDFSTESPPVLDRPPAGPSSGKLTKRSRSSKWSTLVLHRVRPHAIERPVAALVGLVDLPFLPPPERLAEL